MKVHVRNQAGQMVLVDVVGVDELPLPYFREVLTGNRTYYVRNDGVDTNDGKSNNAGGAFKTLAKAISVVGALDLSIFSVVIKIGQAGTYAGFTVGAPFVGGPGSYVEIEGDTSAASSYVISSACVAQNYGVFRIKGVKLQSSGNGLQASSGTIHVTGAIVFGTTTSNHIYVERGGVINIAVNYTVDGGAVYHIQCRDGGFVFAAGITVTVNGTITVNWVVAFNNAVVQLNSNTFNVTGTATGQRFNVSTNAIVFVLGASSTYLPGSIAGVEATGGKYA